MFLNLLHVSQSSQWTTVDIRNGQPFAPVQLLHTNPVRLNLLFCSSLEQRATRIYTSSPQSQAPPLFTSDLSLFPHTSLDPLSTIQTDRQRENPVFKCSLLVPPPLASPRSHSLLYHLRQSPVSDAVEPPVSFIACHKCQCALLISILQEQTPCVVNKRLSTHHITARSFRFSPSTPRVHVRRSYPTNFLLC